MRITRPAGISGIQRSPDPRVTMKTAGHAATGAIRIGSDQGGAPWEK